MSSGKQIMRKHLSSCLNALIRTEEGRYSEIELARSGELCKFSKQNERRAT